MFWFWLIAIVYWIGVFFTYSVNIKFLQDPNFDELRTNIKFSTHCGCFIASMFIFPVMVICIVIFILLLLLSTILSIPLMVLFKIFELNYTEDTTSVIDVSEEDINKDKNKDKTKDKDTVENITNSTDEGA